MSHNNKGLRLPCYAHTLQLVVNSIIKSTNVKVLITKIRKKSNKINKSPNTIQNLKKYVAQNLQVIVPPAGLLFI
jgi:hypothetical protein